jgi:D-arabinose 1-dehydrogenase-like Zn-dependent alcohol dehydrogenase
MRAVVIEQYAVMPTIRDVPTPTARPDGVVLRVEATGLCRSDWHGWQGHDSDITLPYVPGHEIAGTISEIGTEVSGWSVGDRVTAPFVCACGHCEQCRSGNHQVCENQEQPGFTYDGSFAEYVAIPFAAVNLVALPGELSYVAAAGLGCRFATAYRGITGVGAVQPGEWLVVFGCGGVGLSAVMIAAALDAKVIAIDTNPAALAAAARFGATETVEFGDEIVDRIRQITDGGAQVTMDALGSAAIVQAALASLRPRGRHVQIGLLPGETTVEAGVLVGRELQWLGSHGMAAKDYPAMLELVNSQALRPAELVTRVISLDEVPDALAAMSEASPIGVTVICPGQQPDPKDRGDQQ